ncbi:MAG: hypothetical protein K0S80_4136 [Neobacillus sp.]|nr:hypothetical protein [Neobacillus sp.]
MNIFDTYDIGGKKSFLPLEYFLSKILNTCRINKIFIELCTYKISKFVR